MPFDLVNTLKSVGYLGTLVSVLLENGVIFLFFMPSDSLLFTAGLLASLGYFELDITIMVCFIGSVLGYMLGYSIGYKAGTMVFREDAKGMMDQKHLEQAKKFYDKYASFALILARFFPVRAFVSTMAGATKLNYFTFMLFNIIGGAIWSVGLVLVGYYFGELLTPKELHYVFGAVGVGFVAVVIAMPFALKYFKKRYSEKTIPEESDNPPPSA